MLLFYVGAFIAEYMYHSQLGVPTKLVFAVRPAKTHFVVARNMKKRNSLRIV